MREDWVIEPVGQLFETVTGGTPPKREKHLYGDYIPFVKPPELLNASISSASDMLSYEGSKIARVLPVNSILVSCIGNLGKIGINIVPVAFNQQINAIKPREEIADPRFIFYQVLSPKFSMNLASSASGTTVPIVNKSKFNSIPIVIPPLPEQKRIVAILDEAFAGIDAAIANTEKNLANAREIFESYLNDFFASKREGWIDTTIGAQIALQRGFDITKKQQKPGKIPVVSSGGAKSFHNEPKVRGPGVVVGRKGSIGRVYFIDHDFWPHDTTLWVKEFNGNSEKLVYFLLQSLNLANLDTGTANPALNRNLVHPLRINWPAIDQHKYLLCQIEKLSQSVNELESIYQQKLNALNELKQSLLAKAFSGELTADSDEILKEAVG